MKINLQRIGLFGLLFLFSCGSNEENATDETRDNSKVSEVNEPKRENKK